MLKEKIRSADRYSEAIREARRILAGFETRNGQIDLPLPVRAIAQQLGYRVVPFFSAGDEISGLVSKRERLIGVNGRHHRHRQRFTIAHEVAHIVLHHPEERKCKPRTVALLNAQADAFASELLVPARLLELQRHHTENTQTLASIFDVSHEVIRNRFKSSGLL